MAQQVTPGHEIFFEVMKSEIDPYSGRIRLEGIATDECLDLDDEVVKAVDFPPCIEYLRAMGKLNLDHGKDVIGDVVGARFENAVTLNKKYGDQLRDRRVVGTGIEIQAELLPIVDPLLAPEDLKRAHHLAKSGAKMGFSIQSPHGMRKTVEIDGVDRQVAVPSFIPLVAYTPLPKNANAVCRVVKSIRDLFT